LFHFLNILYRYVFSKTTLTYLPQQVPELTTAPISGVYCENRLTEFFSQNELSAPHCLFF
jgi:hypothetical protein